MHTAKYFCHFETNIHLLHFPYFCTFATVLLEIRCALFMRNWFQTLKFVNSTIFPFWLFFATFHNSHQTYEVSQIHAYFFKDSFGDPFQNLILTVLEKISYGSASLKTQSLRWIQLYIHDSPPKINSPLKYTIVIWLHAIANALHCAFKKVRTSSVCRCSTFVLAVDSWHINHVIHLNLSEK